MKMETIPKDAKCVFKGIMFDVYHWKQKMFDGSYTTYEAVRRPKTVVILPIMDDMIALSLEEQPRVPKRLQQFCGKAERGETPLNAAKRELLEEAGMESKDWKLIDVKNGASGMRAMEWNLYFYIARNCKVVSKPITEPGERIEIKKFTLKEFMNLKGKDVDPFLTSYIESIKKGGIEKFRKLAKL